MRLPEFKMVRYIAMYIGLLLLVVRGCSRMALQVHEELQVNQLVFDYRGYGSSRGSQKPSEAGLVADALTALKYLHIKASRGEIDRSKIILCGRSLGGAVVSQLASSACDAAKSDGLSNRERLHKRGFAAAIP